MKEPKFYQIRCFAKFDTINLEFEDGSHVKGGLCLEFSNFALKKLKS